MVCVCVFVALGRAWGKLERLLPTSIFESGHYTGRGQRSEDNVHMTLHVTNSICEWPLISAKKSILRMMG